MLAAEGSHITLTTDAGAVVPSCPAERLIAPGAQAAAAPPGGGPIRHVEAAGNILFLQDEKPAETEEALQSITAGTAAALHTMPERSCRTL